MINYPAVESIKEAAALPYEDFLSSTVHIDSADSYKAFVNHVVSERSGKLNDFAAYGSEPFTRAIAHTVGKIQHLVEGIPVDQTFPFTRGKSLSEACWSIPRLDLLDYQLDRYSTSGTVATCGTGHFFIAMWKRSLDGAYKSFHE